MASNEGEEALLTWVQSFPEISVKSLVDLSTCVDLALICTKVDSEFFGLEWKKNLSDTSLENKDLCKLNAIKVCERVLEYYKECLKLSFVNIDTPKSDEVATGNIKEIACLIQFILGAAVNCDNKNDFIGSLMTLDEYVQGELMAYIQIILDSCVPVGEESSSMDEEDLRQRLFELEKELALSAEENQALRSDLESAKSFISDRQNGKSNGEIDLMERRAIETQRRLDEVQEELMMMEHQREEESIRLEVALREADDWRQRTEVAEQKADEVAVLKDEVDYLREKADKATRLQASLDSLRSKAEESNELRKKLRDAEELSAQATRERDEELRKLKSYKTQLQTTKQALVEAQSKAVDDDRRVQRLENDLRAEKEKSKVSEAAAERVTAELISLKALNEELSLNSGNMESLGESLAAETAAGDDMSLMPPQVREKMIRLQSENKRLSEQVDREISRGRSDNVELNDTIENLRSEKQSLTDKIKELETKLAEGGVKEDSESVQELEEKVKSVTAENAKKKEEFNSVSAELNAAKEKNSEVEALLKQKDEDIKAMETRYRSYLEKARSVIKTLDPKNNNNTEVVALRAQVAEKDRLIRRLEAEKAEKGKARDQEEKLLVSAWYNLGNKTIRGAVDERVGRSQPGQSFLARQRQQTQQRRNQQSAINKSRALVDSLEKLPETGSDLIEIDFDEDGHRKLTEASYTAMPYKVSVRSTLPPKIRVNGQRPEITRKSLGSKEYHLERRQPEYLEKKHGERGINRYFRTRKMEEAEESLRAEKRVGWDDVSDEYRKELKRQSEMRRLQGPSEKWWELTTPEFHYNHHKALDAERRCSSQAETYRRGLKKNSDLFWTY
ncbi:Oidioi.mRNA.OKI2018_I69.chr2.g7494.t1.cds [Oikopleura dioica]|uniref:Oidioi.mRNA.OKI2018_I69.chr2.g7494.t1.cds n=1 Tax=Oikopleura dioica TaxID=34765 RepID=A0ABN7TCT8_OIKDI|nr:Oidioi.mRNA.OKI2018_I69.chr2.g7494.t1.cds [Oikopleura dioica]